MRKQLISRTRLALLPILTAASACTSAGSAVEVPFDDFGTFNGAKIEVVAEGGIAALSVLDRVEHDNRAFVHVQRHICDRNCGAPMDSASGVLASAKTDSLFNIVLEQNRLLSRNEYGTTPNAADMMFYTIRITANGQTRTIRGDDGAMPEPGRRIVDAVRAIVSAARK